MLQRLVEKLFVNKNAIKSKFGNILEKVGISRNGWELFWEFQDFQWEFHSFGSSNTGYLCVCCVSWWCNKCNVKTKILMH